MTTIKELLREIDQKTFSYFNECTAEITSNFQAWLDEFHQNAADQIKNVNNGEWHPKTPKRNTRKKRTSRLSSQQTERKISRKSFKLADESFKASEFSQPDSNLRESQNTTKRGSTSRSETEEDDVKKMPPPEPSRSKRLANQSLQKSVQKKSARKSKASRKRSSAVKCPNESSMHLLLESASTDEGSPLANNKNTAPKCPTVVLEKLLGNECTKEPTNPANNRRTFISRVSPNMKREVSEKSLLQNSTGDAGSLVAEGKSSKRKSLQARKNNVDTSRHAEGTKLEETALRKPTSTSESETEKRLSAKRVMVILEKIDMPVLVHSQHVNKLNESSKNGNKIHVTPRIQTLSDAKRSLHSNFINNVKTPQSPKQLFSAYSKGDIREKALAFEKAQQNSTVLRQTDNSLCSAKKRRSSMHRKSQERNTLLLARAARMSTSTRRSSLMRIRLSSAYNNCIKKRLSDKENLQESMAACVESEEHDCVVEETPPSVLQNEREKDTAEKSFSSGSTVNYSSAKSSIDAVDTPSPATSPEDKRTKTIHNNVKRISNGKAYKRPLPASETKMPNKVTALVSQFDKKFASTSKAQGFTHKFSGVTALMNNSSFKPIKKHSNTMACKPSREVLLETQRAKEEEAYRKRMLIIKEKKEESKRKNEEKQQKVLQNRLKEQQATETLRRTLERQKQNQIAAKKTIQEKKKSLLEAKKNLRLKREMELEKRRKEEEQRLLRQKRLEEQRQQELAKLKKQQEKREQEVKMFAPSTAAVPATKILPSLNRTFTTEKSPQEVTSYDITPHRSELPKEDLLDSNNYDINDLKSDDETDDENDPRKIIPNWAQGVALRVAVINQHRNPPDLEKLFPPIKTCSLEKIFKIQRSRFHARTSSAVWHVPPLPPIH